MFLFYFSDSSKLACLLRTKKENLHSFLMSNQMIFNMSNLTMYYSEIKFTVQRFQYFWSLQQLFCFLFARSIKSQIKTEKILYFRQLLIFLGVTNSRWLPQLRTFHLWFKVGVHLRCTSTVVVSGFTGPPNFSLSVQMTACQHILPSWEKLSQLGSRPADESGRGCQWCDVCGDVLLYREPTSGWRRLLQFVPPPPHKKKTKKNFHATQDCRRLERSQSAARSWLLIRPDQCVKSVWTRYLINILLLSI